MAANYVLQIFVVMLAMAIVCANPGTCKKKFQECTRVGSVTPDCKTKIVSCFADYCNKKFKHKAGRRYHVTIGFRVACYARYAIPVYLWTDN
ncbi:hypothetical protein ScPMuIL_006762 [Solemya velum]